jgi:16S rRNA (guanine527-N7)-methyltransferase
MTENKPVSHETENAALFLAELKKAFAACALALTDEQAAQMERYYRVLAARNRTQNLTRIIAPRDAAIKHFLDSAFPQDVIPAGSALIDVGSGAGFPAVPLKILRTDIEAYALEAAAKKCAFIRNAAAQADVRIYVVNERAEEYARGAGRAAFDVCVSRAVAELPVLMELCAPLLRTGGLLLAYKSGAREEADGAARALGLVPIGERLMPLAEYDHRVLLYRKERETPEQYPRKYAKIRKNPL